MRYLLIWLLTFPLICFGGEISDYKTQRDSQLIRQTKKYSCGSAALATLMQYYLGYENFNELVALNLLDSKKDKEASFFDLQQVVKHFGLNGIGLELTAEEFFKIQHPVIAYIKTPLEADHFVVIKGLAGQKVFIGDPAAGNYFLTRTQFLKTWLNDNKNLGLILFISGNYQTGKAQFFNELNEPNSYKQKIFFNR
jgi:predicted double-glycine peptidase